MSGRSPSFRLMEKFLTSALDEIERTSALDPAELDHLSKALRQACEYNAAHFWDGFPRLLKHQFIKCLAVLGPPISTA